MEPIGGLITTEMTTNRGGYRLALFGSADGSADRCIVLPDAQPGEEGQLLKGTAVTATELQVGETWSNCLEMTRAAESGATKSTVTSGVYTPFGLCSDSDHAVTANVTEAAVFAITSAMDVDSIVVEVRDGYSGGISYVQVGMYKVDVTQLGASTPVDINGQDGSHLKLSLSSTVSLSAGTPYYFTWTAHTSGARLSSSSDQDDAGGVLRAAGFAGLRVDSTGLGASLSLLDPLNREAVTVTLLLVAE